MQSDPPMKNPSWWNDKHDGVWDRIKSAMKRDWEQTKADLSSKGHDLDQGVTDTVKQAVGADPIPPANTPNPSTMDRKWDDIEPSYRYGAGAREQYGTDFAEWNPGLESRLSSEWNEHEKGRSWDDAKHEVRSGWDAAKK